ncbi:MAG: hypothetical protein NTV81_04265 [Candidatus Komeilibacteria bacterium]|nr:hypothetical protein [Candidatus Komeilibacteria bacterium]
MSKYGHRPINWFEAIVNKIGGEEAAEKFLRGELAIAEPTRSWREQDGIIYFTVISDGKTGPEWITYLEGKGFQLSKYAKSLLNSPDFKPTNGVIIEVGVLKGMLFNDSDRTTKNIRSDAEARKFIKPNAELACLIRDKFTDEDIEAMGLTWIITMHEPIVDSDGDLGLLGVDRRGGGRGLFASYDRPGYQWYRSSGFAFVLSQVSQ